MGLLPALSDALQTISAAQVICVALPRDQPVKSFCTDWGNDADPRHWDMLIDGVGIATERLSLDRPGDLYDVEQVLPANVLAGNAVLTRTRQAQPAGIGGGVIDLRLVKPDEFQ